MPNAGFWVAGLVVTADRANAGLMQTGAEGDFDSSQTGLTFLETATGKIKRATGAGWEVLVDKDPAVGVGGLRTLGTGAQQAAQGTHTHTNVQEWTTAGPFTWTKPAGALRVLVQLWAGGAGAGGVNAVAGGGGGGGGGGHIEVMFEASELGATEDGVVGAAGVGALGADGTDGGDSSFGAASTLVSAIGGKKGLQGASGAGGAAGTPGGTAGGNGAAATGNGISATNAVVGGGGGGGGCAGGWTPGNGGTSTLSGQGWAGMAQGHGGSGVAPSGGGGGGGSSGSVVMGGDGAVGRVRVITYTFAIPSSLP